MGLRLLSKCHEIVRGEWAEDVRAMTPAQRLDFDVDSIFLKVDAENRAAIDLYKVTKPVAVYGARCTRRC